MRQTSKAPDLSIVVSFRDDEETVGHRVKAMAKHVRSLGLAFEIVAVNDGSRDNSVAILTLCAAHLAELRLIGRDVAGRAFVRGVAEARAPIVMLVEAAAHAPLAPLGWALSRLAAGREAIILRGRYVVARRLVTLPAVVRAGGRGEIFERSFERAAGTLGLDVVGTRPRTRRSQGLLAPVLRLLAA